MIAESENICIFAKQFFLQPKQLYPTNTEDKRHFHILSVSIDTYIKKTINMRKYNLGFISDKDIFKHVKETVQRYSANIDLKEFNKNIVDPIKLTFDAKVYGRTM